MNEGQVAMIYKSAVPLLRQLYIEFLLSKPCLLWHKFQWLVIRALL
jgi:hypothetical protein